jgi:hypothetical protein
LIGQKLDEQGVGELLLDFGPHVWHVGYILGKGWDSDKGDELEFLNESKYAHGVKCVEEHDFAQNPIDKLKEKLAIKIGRGNGRCEVR